MSNETLSIILFLVFVAATLAITVWASRNTKTATDFYAGGRTFSGAQNGLAIGGDYMSAASFLGIAGLIALYGYDGFLYSIGFLVAWLVALLLVAELLRNSGRFTMADVLAFRMSPRPVRTAAGVSTIVVSIFYLLAQMVGAGALVALLFGFTSDFAKGATIALVGVLMIVYVVFGGMKGTTWVQIVKAVLLMTGATLITLLVLGHSGFNLNDLLNDAADQSGKGGAFLEPGLRYATEDSGLTGKLDLISLGLALVLGTAGLPHILIRFYTVPTARDARKSVLWGIGIIGTFYLLTLVLGFGAAALVGSKEIAAVNPAATPRRRSSRSASARSSSATRAGRSCSRSSRRSRSRRSSRSWRASPSPRPRRSRTTCTRTCSARARPRSGTRSASPASPPSSSERSDRPRNLRAAAQRRVPRRPRVRGRRVRQPARDPLQPVLEAVQHQRRRRGHLRRARLGDLPGRLLAGRVG